MAQSRKIVASGIPGPSALIIVGDGITAQAGAGSTQATATPLQADVNAFSTTASSTGAILPRLNAGDSVIVRNGGANDLLVYPAVGGTINALAANAGYSVTAGNTAVFFAASALILFGMQAA